jgi:DNA-damage-inducible protein D
MSDEKDRENALVVFQGKGIRRIWHDGQWHFSIVDVIEVLTESTIPKRYWSDLKIKLKDLNRTKKSYS